MKSVDSNDYNTRLKQIKERILKSLIGNERTEGIKTVLNLRNNYSKTITNDAKANKALDLLTDIINIDNINDLAQLEGSLNESKLNDFQDIIEPFIKEDKFYKQEHVESITDFDSMDKNELLSKDGIEVSEVDSVKIYELKGIPFSFMIHAGDYKGKNGMGQENVHCSMINNENRNNINRDRMVLVFNNINADNINYMTTRDSGTYGQDSNRTEDTRMLPDEFFANMSKKTGEYNDYQLNTQDSTLQPNAICVYGRITDEDIRTAKLRGIDVIYSIDEEMYKDNNERKQEQFDKLFSEYKESFNPKMVAMLKNKNPYTLDEFLDIIKNSINEQKGKGNTELLNENINALKRAFRRELKDANEQQIENGDELLEKFYEIDNLRDEKVISVGSTEEKDFRRYKKVERLKEAIKGRSPGNAYQIVDELLEKSDNFDKDISSITSFIEENSNIENMKLYEQMILACENQNIFVNGGNSEVQKKIEELRTKITPEQLQERGQASNEISLGKIYSYFIEKNPSIDEIVSSISTIKEERYKVEEKKEMSIDLRESAIEASEISTKTDIMKSSVDTIKRKELSKAQPVIENNDKDIDK